MNIFVGVGVACLLLTTSMYAAVQVIPRNDRAAALGRALGEGLSEGLLRLQRAKEQAKKQQELKEDENKQLLLEAAEYLISRKHETGKLTNADLNHAALKFAIATGSDFDTSLLIMHSLSKKI